MAKDSKAYRSGYNGGSVPDPHTDYRGYQDYHEGVHDKREAWLKELYAASRESPTPMVTSGKTPLFVVIAVVVSICLFAAVFIQKGIAKAFLIFLPIALIYFLIKLYIFYHKQDTPLDGNTVFAEHEREKNNYQANDQLRKKQLKYIAKLTPKK